MSSKQLHFRVRETLSGVQKFLPRFFCPGSAPPSRGTQIERGTMPYCDALTTDQSQSLPPELDLSPFNDSGAPPKSLVEAVQNLKPFLPEGCEFLGQGDLKIIGLDPVDAGGFADVWMGERNGTPLAIKSYRRHSSLNCLPMYSVSRECHCAAFSSFNVTRRDYITKR